MSRRFLPFWALVIAVSVAGQDSETLRELAEARRLKDAKSFASAVRAYESALPELRKSPDRALVGRALLEGGQMALASGRYDLASEWSGEAAAIFADRKQPAEESQAWNVVASAHLYRAEYAPALAGFQKAVELDRRQKDGANEITHLSNIGGVYFLEGKYLDALDSYEQALARADTAAGASWQAGRRQLVLANLAILYEQLGQREKALDYYQRALALGPALTTSDQIQLLSSIGTLYRRMGDAVKALQTYDRAQKLLEHTPQSAAEVHILQNIGIAQALDMHNLSSAVDAFSSALQLAEQTGNRREIVLAHLFRGEAYYRMKHWAEAAGEFGEALQGARAISGREEEWTALYGKGRLQRQGGDPDRALATFRESIAIIESIRSSLGVSGLKTEFLGDKREVYDAAIELMLRDPECDTAQLFALIEQARSRNLQDRLRNREAPTLSAVQAKLHPGTMLIEYWTGGGQVAALWLTPRSAGMVSRPFRPDEATAIERLGSNASDDSWRAGAESAGQTLLAGIPLDSTVRDVIIAPDGPLSAVPFELMKDAPGGPMLIERYAVSYLPSAAILFRSGEHRKKVLPWNPRLEGFGDPVVNSSAALALDQRWNRLPESARELRAIATILPGRSEIHTEKGDLKRILMAEAPRAPVLHLSTHAAADTADPNRSRILFTVEPGRRGSEYLFRNEVQALSLGNVDMVTLSACETEGGKVVRGEGVQSFSRAFLAAGARSTVTTLWRVADGPTAEFMEMFYQGLARGEDKAQALRVAKLAFLRSGSELAHPAYWAAFVLNGDGQEPIPPVYSWWWFVAAGTAIALSVAIYVLRRQAER